MAAEKDPKPLFDCPYLPLERPFRGLTLANTPFYGVAKIAQHGSLDSQAPALPDGIGGNSDPVCLTLYRLQLIATTASKWF